MSLAKLAPVIRVRPAPGGALVIVQCPFCGGPHEHLIPWQEWRDVEATARAAPCVSATVQAIDPARYFLRTPPGY